MYWCINFVQCYSASHGWYYVDHYYLVHSWLKRGRARWEAETVSHGQSWGAGLTVLLTTWPLTLDQTRPPHSELRAYILLRSCGLYSELNVSVCHFLHAFLGDNTTLVHDCITFALYCKIEPDLLSIKCWKYHMATLAHHIFLCFCRLRALMCKTFRRKRI